MAWKTWTAGDVLTAADINAQSPTLCTSATRPTGGNLYEGVLITETDTNRILYYDGTDWIIMAEPQVTWTPTMTGLTVGNGSWDGEYHRSDGWLDFRARFTFGSTSAITATLLMTLPVAAAKNSQNNQHAVSFFDLDVVETYPGVAGATGNNTQVYLLALNTGGTYGRVSNTSSTVPMTWATNDVIDISGRYRMTTRYS